MHFNRGLNEWTYKYVCKWLEHCFEIINFDEFKKVNTFDLILTFRSHSITIHRTILFDQKNYRFITIDSIFWWNLFQIRYTNSASKNFRLNFDTKILFWFKFFFLSQKFWYKYCNKKSDFLIQLFFINFDTISNCLSFICITTDSTRSIERLLN